MDINIYLGVAIKNPLVLQDGKPVLSSDNDVLKEAIQTLLTTPIGTRFFLPEYGSRLHELLFEPNDEVLESLFRLFVFEAIEKWEKRVKFVNLECNYETDGITATIYYRILANSEIDSFIFPFYRSLKY